MALRLAGGGFPNQGRVEVSINGVWGTICDRKWSPADARVVCRKLGLPHERLTALKASLFGGGSGRVWLENMQCYGDELNVLDCPHRGLGNVYRLCNKKTAAAVICGQQQSKLRF